MSRTPGTITQDEFALLRGFLERECGLNLASVKTYLVESRLAPVMAAEGCETFGELYLRLTDPRRSDLRDRVIEAMATHETLWFRDRAPFEALRNAVLPELAGRPAVRIWSAACSTGQEPYSIAMAVLDTPKPPAVEIVATDISAPALHLAQGGRYDRLSMSRGMDPEMRRRYFDEEGPAAVVRPEVRALVRFQRFNLLHDPSRLGRFDVVFCRNVAIYFSDRCRAELFDRLWRNVDDGGFLFLGGTEVYPTLLAGSRWNRLERDGAVYYRRSREG